jgi:hypothetical protein
METLSVTEEPDEIARRTMNARDPSDLRPADLLSPWGAACAALDNLQTFPTPYDPWSVPPLPPLQNDRVMNNVPAREFSPKRTASMGYHVAYLARACFG